MKKLIGTISFVAFICVVLLANACSTLKTVTTTNTTISNAITPPTTISSQFVTTISSITAPVSTITGTYTRAEALAQAQYYQGLADDARATATDDLDKSQRDPSMANFYVQAYNDQMDLYQNYLQQANDWRAYAANAVAS